MNNLYLNVKCNKMGENRMFHVKTEHNEDSFFST